MKGTVRDDAKNFRQIFQHFPIVMVLIRKSNGEILELNPAAEAFFGFSRKDMLGHSTAELGILSLEVSKLLMDKMDDLGRIQDEEVLIRTNAEDLKTVQISMVPTAIQSEECLLLTLKDVSDTRRSEVTLRQIYDNSNVGFVLADPTGRILSVNGAFASMLGMDRKVLLGTNFGDLTHPEDLEVEMQNFRKIVQGEMDSYRIEKRYIKKDQKHLWVRVNINTLRNGNGDIEKFIGVVENIQDIKEKESAFKDLNRKYLMQVERMPLAYMEIDRRFIIQTWNPAAEKIFGYTALEVLGKDSFSLLSPEEELDNVLVLQKKLQGASGGEHHISRSRRKDGHILICEWVNTPLFDPQGEITGWVSLCTDITQRVEVEQKLRIQTHQLSRAKEAAEAANKAKSIFLANMSHEIRTPLHAVIGFSDLLTAHLTEGTPKEYLSAIRSASETLLSLINDILDLSKIEAEKLEIQPSSQNIHTLLQELESLFSLKALEKGLDFLVESPSGLPERLLYDDLRLRQVLLNLLGNAIKFTDKGAVTLKTQAFQQTTGRWDLKFFIHDTGIGIPHEFQQEIFNPFRQWNTQVTRKYGGTGLGLSIAKQLTVMMGGTITFTSGEGQGTTFILSLPGLEVPGFSAPTELPKDHAEIHWDGKLVLVVDDVAMNRKLMKHYLSPSGVTILEAQDGQEALERIEMQKPDLVFMDIRMPRMDGQEALNILKATPKWKNIPVIALTASVSQGKFALLASGFDDVQTKPVKQKEILTTLERFFKIQS